MNICVYCSSSDQVRDEFKQQATELGRWMARNGHTLVYGGATGGLMSAVAQGAADEGGDIVGIIPECIIAKGRKSDLPTEVFVVGDMAELWHLMFKISGDCLQLSNSECCLYISNYMIHRFGLSWTYERYLPYWMITCYC